MQATDLAHARPTDALHRTRVMCVCVCVFQTRQMAILKGYDILSTAHTPPQHATAGSRNLKDAPVIPQERIAKDNSSELELRPRA